MIDWRLFTPITLGLIVGSWIGVQWAVKFGNRWVRWLLVAVVIASAIKLIVMPA